MPRTKPPAVLTREKYYGISAKSLAARTRRRIAVLRKKMDDIEAPWEDVDNAVLRGANDLRAAVADFEKVIDDAVAYLKEEMPE